MSKKLSEEEKEQRVRERRLRHEELERERELNPELGEREYEILRILREAQDHPDMKINAKYLEDHFKKGITTIYRSTDKLKKMDLIEAKQVNGSYVIKKGIEQLYSNKTMQNIALVASLKGLLQQYKGTPLFESVTKLIYFLEPKVVKNDSLLSTGRVTVPPQMEYNINLKNWNKVYEAIQKNRKINFRYNGPYSNSEVMRTVWPYQLLLDNTVGTVYVFGHSEYNDMDILYTLNRMENITISDETFELPDNYDFSSRCGGGRLGAFKGDEIEEYKIRFTDYAMFWIKEHKWADDQKFEEDEGSVTITFSSTQFYKIKQLVLSWGCQAEPLAPKHLVDEWKEEVTAMYKMIKDV